MLRNELTVFFRFPTTHQEFFSGDTVNGDVELKVAHPLKIKFVRIIASGAEITERDGKTDKNVLFSTTQVLRGLGSDPSSASGDILTQGLSLLGFKTPDKVTELPAGVHTYPFSVKLPDFLPGSYKALGARIEYTVTATVISGVKGMSDLESVVFLPIGGSIHDINFIGNTSVPFVHKESQTFFLSKGALDIDVGFDSKCFHVGETINVRVLVNNQSSKTVTNASVRLTQRIVTTCSSNENRSDIQLAVHSIGSLPPKAGANYTAQLPIPTIVPESSVEKVISSTSNKIGKLIHISYFVEVVGNVSLGSDLKVAIPIFVVRRPPGQGPAIDATTAQQAAATDYNAQIASTAPVMPVQDAAYHQGQFYPSVGAPTAHTTTSSQSQPTAPPSQPQPQVQPQAQPQAHQQQPMYGAPMQGYAVPTNTVPSGPVMYIQSAPGVFVPVVQGPNNVLVTVGPPTTAPTMQMQFQHTAAAPQATTPANLPPIPTQTKTSSSGTPDPAAPAQQGNQPYEEFFQ